MKQKLCECCGQKLPERRLGVALTPIKARVFDLVKAQSGITAEQLRVRMGMISPKTPQSHVYQLNDKLMDTGWKIVGKSWRGFRLVREGNSTVDKTAARVYSN